MYIGLDLPNEYSGSKYTHSIKAVSYTHLDVYKRQQQMCLLELSLNLKNRLKVYSGQDSFILMPAATRPKMCIRDR